MPQPTKTATTGDVAGLVSAASAFTTAITSYKPGSGDYDEIAKSVGDIASAVTAFSNDPLIKGTGIATTLISGASSINTDINNYNAAEPGSAAQTAAGLHLMSDGTGALSAASAAGGLFGGDPAFEALASFTGVASAALAVAANATDLAVALDNAVTDITNDIVEGLTTDFMQWQTINLNGSSDIFSPSVTGTQDDSITVAGLTSPTGVSESLTDTINVGGSADYSELTVTPTSGGVTTTVSGSGATASIAVLGTAIVNGEDDTIDTAFRSSPFGGNPIGATVDLTGTNDVVTGTAANVVLEAPAEVATLNVSDGTVEAQQAGDQIDMGAGSIANVITGAQDVTVVMGNSDDGVIDGIGVQVELGSSDKVDLNGAGIDDVSSASGTGDVVDIAAGQTVDINTSGITVIGSSGDHINVTGQDDTIFADSSTIEVTGIDTGDVVHGSGNTGDTGNWGGYIPSSGSYGGYSGGGYEAARPLKKLPIIARSNVADLFEAGTENVASNDGTLQSAGSSILVAAQADGIDPQHSLVSSEDISPTHIALPEASANSTVDQMIHAMASWPMTSLSAVFTSPDESSTASSFGTLGKPNPVRHPIAEPHAHLG